MRARILRDTQRGPGLLAADGKQLPFTLEDHWRGASAPVINQTVDLELDAGGALLSVTPVEAKRLAEEKARVGAELALKQGQRLLQVTSRKLDPAAAIGVVAMLLGTTVFSFLSMRIMSSQSTGITLYQLLGMLSGGGGQLMMSSASPGFLMLLLWLGAVFGPLLPSFVAHPRARLAFFLPALLWLVVIINAVIEIQRALGASRQMASFLGSEGGRFASEMTRSLWSSTSLGLGFYLSLIVAAYFAFRGVSALRRAA